MNDNNLRSLYNNTRKLNPSFQVDYNTFASDMQDENNRKAFYSNLKSLNPKFQVDYDQFSKDMGFSSNNPQPSVSEKGYTRKIDERGDTTYIAPDVTISSDLPEDAKQKNVANSTTETQPSFNITIPDYASQIKTTEINPFKSKSLGEVIQDNFQKYASNPQNIFNVQFENFKNNPDLYRTGNEDYSKKRLTQEASNYLEGKRDDLKRTITDRAHGDVYDVVEKGKGAIPEEESNLVKDFLTNTEEGKAYVEFEKEQLKQLDDKIDALKSKISDSEKNSKKVIVSRFHIFPGSEGYFSADEVPENYKDIDEAKSQLAELEKYRNAVNDENKGFFSQFFNELGRRSDKAAVSLSTLGISKIMENKLWNDVLKNPDNKLTNEASQLLNQYQQMHSVDRSMAQDIAKGTADNIDYVEQFAVTGGAASAATKGTSVAIAEKLGGSIATKAIGDMGEGLAKAFVRTVLMPNTISNAYEQNINNPGSFLDSYANSFRQNLIQNFTETLGEHMPESLRFLPSKETKIGSIANSIAEHTGFQGLIPQMTEQEIVKVLNATSGDGNWSDLIDPRNQLITFGTIAAMQLPYSSISAAGYASGKFRNIKQKKSINKAYQENLNNINSVFGNESKELINDINNKLDSDNDGTSMFKLLIAVENSKEFTDSQKDAIAKYGLSYLAYSGLDKAKSEEIQQVQQKAVDAINRNINPDMNGIVKAKVAGTERQIIKGNISWNKDGSINEEQSSPQVYYKDDNGKIQIAPIAYVEKVTEHIPQENALDQAVNMKTNQMILQQANDEDPYVGKSVGFNDSGHAGTIKVNSLNEYGTYNIDIADNETGSSINSTITKQELQQLFEPTNSKENEAPATGKTNQMTGNNAVTYETKGSNADNPSEQKKASTVEEITARAPKQDNGEIDYKTLLNQSPEDYAILLENESTPEEVEKELSAHSKTLQKNIDKKSKKLEKESDPNKRKTIRDDIASDTKQKENIDAIIASRYWNKETTPTEANKEEVTPTEKPVSQEGENVNPETQKSSGKNFISKHEGHPLTRVENLGMGQNQAKGTYVSFEPKNRYETEHNKAKNVEISIQNPITFDQNQNDFAKFQQKTLENRYEDFKASDFSSINEGEVPTIDNLNEKGIDRLSGFVTEELQKQGHDGIVFDGDGEHEIVVFDKNNVRDKNVTQAEIKSNTGVKSKQRAKRTNLQTPRTELQKFIDNTAPANLYQATLLNLMSGGQLSRQHYFDATGYKTNDLGRLKFLLTDKGTPFDIFEQNYYSAYRPEEFNQGFDSNTDEIVQAINDYKKARGSWYELMKKFGEGKQEEYYENDIGGLIEDKPDVVKFSKPNIFDHFYELYSNNLQNFTTFDEFLEFLDKLKENGEFSEHSFPFTPNDYTDIKNYIENARNEGKSYKEEYTGIIRESSEDLGRWETDSGNSDAGIGSVSVPSMGKRTPDRTDNERESKPVKSRGDENPETGTESGTNKLTQLQQKYVDEQKTAYNKKITDDKKALDSAISERNKNVKEFYKANSPFRGETEQRNMFSDEEMTNISNENAKRINEKYQSAVDNAREEYNRLVNDRPSVIERFAKEAQSQTEIATEKSPQEKLDDVGGDLIAHAKRESKSAEIKSEEERVDTNPTDAQKEAGNYQKGHVKVQGFDVSIENPKGSTRSGTDENGEAWNQEMKNSYGYIRRTTGMDGDHIDVFLGNNPASKKVFVVDQNRPSDGKFDEHKVMLGFNSIDEARDAYLSNYEDGWKGLGNITETTVDDFSKWVDKDGARTKPFSDYKDNQKETPDNMRFQTASEKLQESQNDFTPITKEQTDALIEPLKAKGLAKDLIYDETEYDKAFDKAKEKLKYKDGTTYGFVTDDKVVYLDPRKLNANTPIHEFGHLYWNVMPSEMKAKITELLKQTPKWKELEDNPAYSYLETDDQKADEIFNTLLGNEGEKSQKVQEIIGNDVKLTDKIKSTIGDVWEWVKANIFQKTDAKINQFTKKTLGELLNGKPVYEEGGSVLDFNRRMIDWKKNNLDESNSSLDGLEIIDTPKHNFKNISEARKWAKENIAGTYHNTNTSEDIDVSKTVIDKYLSQSAVGKSANLDVHLSTLKQLPKLIETSVLLETSQDRDNKPKIKEIQRLYGAINLEGDNYPVKITVKAYSHGKNNAYSYEVMNIETPEKGAGTPTGMNKNSNYAALPDVDVNKSHDKDTNISETNKNNENNARFQIILTNPTEDTPKHEPGEHPLDYAKRVTRWLREQAKQKELSEGQPANDGGKNMVGISHEALNDLAKRTGLPPIERGIGYNLKELANRGRKLLAAGADPKQIEDDFYNKKLLDGNMISVIRAKIEDLKKNIDSISDKSSKAFKDNFDEWNHYIQVVKHMGTKAGNDFGSLRGQRDLDTDTFSYIALATQNKTGKSLTEIQKNKIEELTKENSDLKQQISDHEKKLIEALDKEHSKIVSTEKAPTTQTPQKKNIVAQGKSLADRIRKAKIHRPDSFMVATPASLAWDGGVEVVARTAETGARLADAIQQGVSYIRNTDWYKNLSDSKKEKAEDDFVNWNNDQSGLTDLQSQFVDKHDNKFTREEAKGIWNYMKQNYISNGTPYADAVSYVANDLGLTMEQVNNAIITPKTKPLADAVWKANRDLSRNRAVTQRWVDEQSHSEAYKKFKKATELFREAAVFGHGGIFVGTHAMPTLFDLPHAKHTVKAMIDAYKFAYGNEANYELMMRDLENSQNYVIAQRAGLQNDPRRFGSDSEITSNWFKKWSTAGERGFNAIKVLRQKLFDIEYEKLSAAEREDSDSVKAIAQIINNATGATNMKMSGWVNDVTFAGGMEASRWERIVKNPAKALGILSKWNRATTAEKVFAKVWTRRAAITAGTYMLGLTINNALNYYFYGDDKHKVNFFNPLKSDWMQYKVGDVTLNPTSGVLSTLRFAVGLASLPFVNSGTIKNEYHADNRLDAFGKDVLKYGEGKLSPFYSTVLENITHHDYSGNTLPFYDDKPLYGFNHKMSYTEYLLSKAPLPIAEASQLYNESIRNQGVPEDKVHAFWKAIEHGVISGTTGARLYDNTKQEGEKYNSLIDYYKKGTEQKLSDIDNDVSTVVSKGKDYSKEYFDAHKHEILEGKDPLKYNDDMQKYINEKLNVDFKKNNDIDLKIKTINKMEKSLPNLKGKEKNDMEERLSKYKDGVIRLHDAMKAKDDSEFDKILKELNK